MIVRVLSLTALLLGLSCVAPTARAETLHDFARSTGELTMGAIGGPAKDDGDRDRASEQNGSSAQQGNQKKK